jgi:hypothetical protein
MLTNCEGGKSRRPLGLGRDNIARFFRGVLVLSGRVCEWRGRRAMNTNCEGGAPPPFGTWLRPQGCAGYSLGGVRPARNCGDTPGDFVSVDQGSARSRITRKGSAGWSWNGVASRSEISHVGSMQAGFVPSDPCCRRQGPFSARRVVARRGRQGPQGQATFCCSRPGSSRRPQALQSVTRQGAFGASSAGGATRGQAQDRPLSRVQAGQSEAGKASPCPAPLGSLGFARRRQAGPDLSWLRPSVRVPLGTAGNARQASLGGGSHRQSPDRIVRQAAHLNASDGSSTLGLAAPRAAGSARQGSLLPVNARSGWSAKWMVGPARHPGVRAVLLGQETHRSAGLASRDFARRGQSALCGAYLGIVRPAALSSDGIAGCTCANLVFVRPASSRLAGAAFAPPLGTVQRWQRIVQRGNARPYSSRQAGRHVSARGFVACGIARRGIARPARSAFQRTIWLVPELPGSAGRVSAAHEQAGLVVSGRGFVRHDRLGGSLPARPGVGRSYRYNKIAVRKAGVAELGAACFGTLRSGRAVRSEGSAARPAQPGSVSPDAARCDRSRLRIAGSALTHDLQGAHAPPRAFA